ncbi:biotin synthase BioB, partial [Streptomyces sp. NPDC002346]
RPGPALLAPQGPARLRAQERAGVRRRHGLHLVNSIFLGDYLTSEGQAGQADLDMIADAGFEVEGAGTTTLPRHRTDAAAEAETVGGCGSHAGGCAPCGDVTDEPGDAEAGTPGARTDLVAVRRRGAGTDLAPNA